MPTNDLFDFMQSATRQMADDYNRIQKRAIEDPGTAGDQGEENWAELLRNWLPNTFHIVTKGRILSDDGHASPQVDVLVLRPEYPPHLLSSKHYLAGGVLAAFECKVTLKGHHIDEFVKHSLEIKTHLERRVGSPYKELQAPMIYGLLAHSHSWKAEGSMPLQHVTKKLQEACTKHIGHPFFCPDLICVADLSTWSLLKLTKVNLTGRPDIIRMFGDRIKDEGNVILSYLVANNTLLINQEPVTPIGSALTNLLEKLAWEYPGLQSLARYFSRAKVAAHGEGKQSSLWPLDIYSPIVKQQLVNGRTKVDGIWDEWNDAIV